MRGIDQVLPVFPRAKGPSQQEGPKIISKKALSGQHSARTRSVWRIAICQLLFLLNFKDHEDETSQLNRLCFYRLGRSELRRIAFKAPAIKRQQPAGWAEC